MGVYESRGQIAKAMKDLTAKWQDVKMDWNDSRSDEMEKEFLNTLEIDARAAGAAMDQMAILLQKVRQECQ
jgi:hypothetical protein